MNPGPLIIATRGLPGSGKTTWARQVVVVFGMAGTDAVAISRDDVRAELGVRHGQDEARVTRVAHRRIRRALDDGRVVVVHDTLLTSRAERGLRELAADARVKLLIEDSFLDVPVAECIARDAERDAPVGAAVIRRMWRAWLWTDAGRAWSSRRRARLMAGVTS
jgi:predicted kinase